MTTAPLAPEQALAMLAALHTDLHASAVLDADDELLAGDPDLGAPGTQSGGDTTVARSATHTVVVVAGPGVLPGVLAIDLKTVLEALGSDHGPV